MPSRTSSLVACRNTAGIGSVVEHLRQPVDDMGTKDNIHKGITLLKALVHVLLLRHAAAHGDDGGGMAALDVLQGPHVAKDPVLGVFPHSAGVEEDKSASSGEPANSKPISLSWP